MSVVLQEVYQRLLEAFGPQKWWPGDTHFEMMVGAILVQNTSWQNVRRAIDNLRAADLLEPHALHDLPEEELQELIRSAGYYRIKAKRLRSLLQFLVERYDGSIEAMFRTPLSELRKELLGIHGVGPETADSILLYAGALPTFVVDAYTYRVFSRHGWIDTESDYPRIQEFFHDHLPADAPMFNEFHALLVNLGKHYCKKAHPLCEACPLKSLLPQGGPIGNDE
ncbi:MAG: endonuclease III domain-containing protein [Thermoguttaceae bacterium]